MGYLSEEELHKKGFMSLGKNVKISDRASIYDCEKIEIGDNSRIDDFCVISGKLKIGSFCHITPMCLLAGGTPGIVLSDFVTLAYGVKIFAQSDDYSGETLTNSLIPREFKAEKFESVFLGPHVIIGAGSIVFPGVELREGCSVGAMSLVNKSTEEWGIYMGVPAKRKKDRKRDLLELKAIFLGRFNS